MSRKGSDFCGFPLSFRPTSLTPASSSISAKSQVVCLEHRELKKTRRTFVSNFLQYLEFSGIVEGPEGGFAHGAINEGEAGEDSSAPGPAAPLPDEAAEVRENANEVRAKLSTRCKEDIDLRRDMVVELRREQVRASPGCCLHDAIERREWPEWERLNGHEHRRLYERSRGDQHKSKAMMLPQYGFRGR